MKKYDDARQRFESFIAVFPDHEWVPEARKKAVKAAWRNCEQLHKSGDSAAARECWTGFMQDFPDNDRAHKAGKLLKEIDQTPDPEVQEEHAGT